MIFWVHAAVAYLLYRAVTVVQRKNDVPSTHVVTLTIGALLPDLVDKPLSFLFTSLPSRSLAHSVFTVMFITAILLYVAYRYDRRAEAVVFGLGYLSHLGADLVDVLFIPRETVMFLLWPLVSDYHHIGTVHDLLALLRPTPYVMGQMVVTLLCIAVWIYDGKPGYDLTEAG